jgi:hypothetical protein
MTMVVWFPLLNETVAEATLTSSLAPSFWWRLQTESALRGVYTGAYAACTELLNHHRLAVYARIQKYIGYRGRFVVLGAQGCAA